MKREDRKRATSAKVLRTAGQFFRENGFASTTVRDIAAASEVSVGTVISVGDKESLLVASFDQRIAAIHTDRAQSGPPSDGGCAEQVAALFDPFVHVFAEQPALARTYGSTLVAGETDSVVFSDLARTLIREIEETLLHSSPAGDDTAPCTGSGHLLRLYRPPIHLASQGSRRPRRAQAHAPTGRLGTLPQQGGSVMDLLPDPWWVPTILVGALLFDAIASLRPPRFISDCLDGVGFPRDWWWALIVVKTLAVAAHLRARLLGQAFWLNCLGMLLLTLATLVVGFLV